MKFCQDFIIFEQCRCADLRFSGRVFLEIRVFSSADTGDFVRVRVSFFIRVSFGLEFQFSFGFQSDVCIKDSVDVFVEEFQEQVSFSDFSLFQGQFVVRFLKDVFVSRLVQQFREEGWNLQIFESFTLVEVYFMMGKSNKLQLEYDWLVVLGLEGQVFGGQVQGFRIGFLFIIFYKQRFFSCFLKFIFIEVNFRLVSVGRGLIFQVFEVFRFGQRVFSWVVSVQRGGLVLWQVVRFFGEGKRQDLDEQGGRGFLQIVFFFFELGFTDYLIRVLVRCLVGFCFMGFIRVLKIIVDRLYLLVLRGFRDFVEF